MISQYYFYDAIEVKLIYLFNVNFDNAYLDEERDVMSLQAHCLLILYAALFVLPLAMYLLLLCAGFSRINM